MGIVEPVFQVLEESGVRYVLVGGLAVVLHGFARLTADIDVIVDFDPEPLRRALEGLQRAGLQSRAPVAIADFADPTVRRAWIDKKGLKVFSLWDPLNPLRQVDLFVEHPVDFDGLYGRGALVATGRATVRVASIDDLLTLKRLANRPEDVLDIEGSFAAARRRKLLAGLDATPAQRIAWLEEMMRIAHASGALPRPRPPTESTPLGEHAR